MRPGGLVPGYQHSDGTYDWTADYPQRRVLQDVVKRGVNLVHAFSNSPPYWMTKSKSVTGATDGGNNLEDDMYDAFASYLATVVKQFATNSTYGNLKFTAVTPLNEPVAYWWKFGGDQEGCHFDRDSQDKILSALAKQLDSMGITATKPSATEENSIDDAIESLKVYSQSTIQAMDLITTHTVKWMWLKLYCII